MRFLRGMLAAAILSIVVAGPAYAQAVGQIFGKVTDNTGAVMPGVTVTVAGTGLQQPLVAVTSQSGTYTFPKVPIGTYSVTFELSGFKKAVRENIVLTSGFDAPVDMKMEVGQVQEAVTVMSEAPLVDTKKTTTGGDFTVDQMLKVPTARDPWQVINMSPNIVLSSVNVGGAKSGQQLGINAYGQGNDVQWNLEGGNITDMSSNSSPMYFNFDSFQEIQVVTGGGDVSVQSEGIFINLITKSGSNVLKGGADVTFENSSMQSNNVTQAQFNSNLAASQTGGLSGNPIHRIDDLDADVGGPIMKNRLWYWGSTDYQDINVGIAGFFNTAAAGCNPPPSTFAQLSAVQGCLANDKTTIQDFNGKLNYQLNTTNKFQLLAQSDRKLRNNRGATASTAPIATQSQYSAGGLWHFTNPTLQLTHTWLPTDKLVFVNQVTHVQGGFFLDFHDYTTCGSSTYQRDVAGQDPTDPTCQWNIQTLSDRTTGLRSRNLRDSYQTERPSWEVKTDDNYFVPHVLGGDHALKFGVGWRKNPVLSYTHVPGGAQPTVQCSGNVESAGGNTCNDSSPFVAAGSPAASGLVPRSAVLRRDGLTNHNWWTWDGYIQDSFTSKRLTISAGLRNDWQDSRFLGGCISANVVDPALLPGQCQGAEGTGHSFNRLSPRVSGTYDLTGHGTTAIHASFSYYYQTEILLADNLSNLNAIALTFGSNQSNGLCSKAAGASCWNDSNHDGIVQANELIGTPVANTSRFVNGVLTNAIPIVDPNLDLARTREVVVGIDHQLAGNLHVQLDYTHRKYDLGAQDFIIGTQPGGPSFPVSQFWTGPFSYTDPQTGISAPYFVQTANSVLPGGNTESATSNQFQTYQGTSLTLTKRLSNRWQGSVTYTWNDFKNFFPAGSYNTTGSQPGNPTTAGNNGEQLQFANGFTNGTPVYTVKAYASYEMPWYGLMASMNLNWQQGAVRFETINGPGQIPNCPPGTAAAACTGGTVSYDTLAFNNDGSNTLPSTKDLDVAISKNFDIGRQKLTVTLNAFNVFNTSTPLSFVSDTVSNNGVNGASSTFNAISSIIGPRVFRIDLRYAF